MNLSLFSLSITCILLSFQSGALFMSLIIVLKSSVVGASDIFLRREMSLVLAAWKAVVTEG